MIRWSFLFILIAVLLTPIAQGLPIQNDAKGSKLEPAADLYVPVEGIDVHEPLVVTGKAINCAGPHAFIVRHTSLVLQNVAVTNCSGQAIVLIGPGASLHATDVTFSGHGSSHSTQGVVIYAQDADVLLERVTIRSNTAGGANAVPSKQQYYPACQDSSHTGGVDIKLGTSTSSSSSDSAVIQQQQPSCGSPILQTSLLFLQSSNLTARRTRIVDNSILAGAVISATGDSQRALQLLDGTELAGNRARWLLVADSWAADAVGRANLMAPQPSENSKRLDMQPPFTTWKLMGGVRNSSSSSSSSSNSAAAVGVRQLPQQFVGAAPRGQTPLQVRLHQASISSNTATEGLLWLRLVNTSIHDASITGNIATGAGTLTTAAATAAAAAATVSPPGPCDVGALHRALLQVHGPAAFDMHRCTVSGNVHHSGALMRVTDGFSLTSLRSSTFRNNTATAVLRFEGRTWVLDTDTFFTATQYLDVLFYTEFEGSSQGAYSYTELQHQSELAKKDNHSLDATWYMADCNLSNNTVYHALLLSVGNRTSWREYISAKADILQAGTATGTLADAEAKARALTLNNSAAAWWLVGCKVQGNRLMSPASVGNHATAAAATTAKQRRGPESAVKVGDQGLTSQGFTDNANVMDANVDVDWVSVAPGGDAYANAVSVVMTADAELQVQLAAGGGQCRSALQQAIKDMQINLLLRRSTRARVPAVLWTSFNQGFMAGGNTLAGNSGFSHILRLDNTMLTVDDGSIESNVVGRSIADLWYGDLHVRRLQLVNNTARNGSILDLESFRGHFEQVTVSQNSAGGILRQSVRSSSSSRSSGGYLLANATSNSSSHPATKSSCTLSPIWRMSHFEHGHLQNITVTNNTGSVALDISGFALARPAEDVLIADNAASGIRMVSTQPKYNKQGIELTRVQVLRNVLSPAAPKVGGLVLGGFDSPVGSYMPVIIQDCEFVDNRPEAAMMQSPMLSLQGGGIQLQGPALDTADPGSQHGFLQQLAITINSTIVHGNAAAEGGGIWTAWPVTIVNCSISNNTAKFAGGGVLMWGLQNDQVGSTGRSQTIIANTSITSNTAAFGGGIACDNCRAVLLSTQLLGNTAIRESSSSASQVAGNSSSSSSKNTKIGGSSGSSSADSSDGSSLVCSGVGSGPLDSGDLMEYTVRGSGGAIAANMAGNSYMVLCGSSSSSSSSSNASLILNNHAQVVGGAVYLNYTNTPTCSVPKPAGVYGQQCLWGSAGLWPRVCGFTMVNVDWSNSSADAGGDLLGWAGDDGFSMYCSNASATGCSRGPQSSNSSSSGGSVHQHGCFVRYTGKSNGACLPPAAAQNRANSQQQLQLQQGSAKANLLNITDDGLRFELPTSLGVYNATCVRGRDELVASGKSVDYAQCAVAGTEKFTVPAVFSGDDMSFTVKLGGQKFDQESPFRSAQLGTIQLHPSNDGLFVIGALNTSMGSSGSAVFAGMALQPVQSPIANRFYQFSFSSSFGDDLLRQVQAVNVQVELLRCTFGQFITINRCVRCNSHGTYSLNPNVQCQSCPTGGSCNSGLLTPTAGFFSYNPFVPQILPCPLKNACREGSQLTQQQVKDLLQRSLLPGSRRQLLMTAAAGSDGGSGSSSTEALPADAAAAAAAGGGGGDGTGSETSQQQQQQQQPMMLNRSAALQSYGSLLADLWTYDPSDGVPLLADVSYAALLDGWQQLQCSPGYTGWLCGACDTNYTGPPGSSSSPVRYGAYMGKCIPCSNPSATWAALFGLFLVLFAYNAFGICMQLYAPQKRLPHGAIGPLQRSKAKRWNSSMLVKYNSALTSGASGTSIQPTASYGLHAAALNVPQPSVRTSGSSAGNIGGVSNGTGRPDNLADQQQQPADVGSGTASSTRVAAAAAAGDAHVTHASEAAAGDDDLALELRPSSLLGKPLGPIPSESLGPFAMAADMQFEVLELAEGEGERSAGTAAAAAAAGERERRGAQAAAAAALADGAVGSSSLMSQQQQQQQQRYMSHMPPLSRGAAQMPHGSSYTSVSRSSSASSLSDVSITINSNWPAAAAAAATPAAAAAAAASPVHTSSLRDQQPSQEYPPVQYSPSVEQERAAAAAAVAAVDQQSALAMQPSGNSSYWQQQQQQVFDSNNRPSVRQRRIGRHEAAELAAAAAAAEAAAAQAADAESGSATAAAATAAAAAPGLVATYPSVGVPLPGIPTGSLGTSNSSAGAGAGTAAAGAAAGQPPGAQMGGPASLLVGMWKIMTSYLQVLAMVRFVHLRTLPEMSYQALAFPDPSAFASYVAFDCLIPGPREYHAITKTLVLAVGLPLLLLAAAFLMWLACWALHHLAAKLHRRYGHARWNQLRRLQHKASVKPDSVTSYLRPRMLITVVVLSYSCYPLVTSNLLHTLACDSVTAPIGLPTSSNYSRLHYSWLEQRAAVLANTTAADAGFDIVDSSSSSYFGKAGQHLTGGIVVAGGSGSSSSSDTALCRPGYGRSLDQNMCWVAGMFWQQDYTIKCFTGAHFGLAMFGLVGLLLLGVLLPLGAGLLLWRNKHRLDDWDYAWKYSFLYGEYRASLCFWEFTIMARKLLFLSVTILLPMALTATEEEVAQLQLQVCVMLAVVCLLIHTSLRPYKRSMLNRLERVGLATVALSYSLLSCAVAVQAGRVELLVLLGVVNFAALMFFLYHILWQLWLLLGDKVVVWGQGLSQAVRAWLKRRRPQQQ